MNKILLFEFCCKLLQGYCSGAAAPLQQKRREISQKPCQEII